MTQVERRRGCCCEACASNNDLKSASAGSQLGPLPVSSSDSANNREQITNRGSLPDDHVVLIKNKSQVQTEKRNHSAFFVGWLFVY